MLKNLITVAFRNIQRQKFFAFLNISGLAIGITATILIGLYIHDELTYDHFHKNLDRIVRVNQTYIWGETDNLFGSTGPAIKSVLESEVPEFETIVRIHDVNSYLVSYNNENGISKVFDEGNILAGDSNLLSVFTFPLIAGNPNTCLVKPNTAIITQATASKYFGKEQPLGKTLQFGEGESKKLIEITGILAKVPTNSHINFDFMLSMNTFPRVEKNGDSWIWTTFVTFGLLNEHASIQSALDHIPRILETRLDQFLKAYRGETYKEYIAGGKEWNLYFQPFSDIHLRSEHVWSRLNEVGSMDDIYIFGTIAFLILIISMINFINLATARAASRAKEVGIRKVIGSGKKNLILQFLTETTAYTLIAVIISVILAELMLPFFNLLSGKDLTHIFLTSPTLLLFLLFGSIILGVIGGIYPAFYLTSFQPAAVLKGKLKAGMGSSSIRNSLVVIQFSISIILISSSLIVFDQMAFTRDYDLGFDRSNKLIINNVNRLGAEKMKAFKEELRNLNLVEGVSLSADAPPFINNGDNFFLDGQEKNKIPLNYNMVDENFIDIYKLPIIAGRSFHKDGTEVNKIIINETAIKSFGLQNADEAIGQNINYYDVPFKVIGVIADFSFDYNEIMSSAIMPIGSSIYGGQYRTLSVKLKREASQEEISILVGEMADKWEMFNNKMPFHFTFLDQEYAAHFAPVLRFGKLLSTFSSLAVFVACLGLVGLIAFVIEKRNKEIGIRKILGASISNIILLLTGQFGKLLGIGLFVAVPLTWYLMADWLSDFQYQTQINWLTFVYAGSLMLFIAFVTTSFQTIRAAMANPTESIKDE